MQTKPYLFKFMITCFFILKQLENTRAQQKQPMNMAFQSYSVEQGISQSSGFTACQDNEGFIWLGTKDGLNRFDGYRFVQQRDLTNSNIINDILETSDSCLWVGTDKGIAKKKRNGTFKRFGSKDAQECHVVKFLEHKAQLWVLTEGKKYGLFRIQSEPDTMYPIKLPKDNIVDLTESADGVLWIATERHLFQWKDATTQFEWEASHKINKVLEKALGKKGRINRIALDYMGRIWIGTDKNGVLILDLKSLKLENPTRLAGNEITVLCKTSSNDMWIGTKTGLSIWRHLQNSYDNYTHQDDDPYSIRRNHIRSIFEDRQHLIWLGVSGGFCKYDPVLTQFTRLRRFSDKEHPITDNMIFGIYQAQDKDSTLYFSTQTDGFVRFRKAVYKVFKQDLSKPNTLLSNNCNGIAADGKGNLWIATEEGLCSFNMKTEQFKSYKDASAVRTYLFAIHKCKNKELLLVSGKNGLFQFDLKTQKWLPHQAVAQKYRAWCILEDKENKIWLATDTAGLVLYDMSTQKFDSYPLLNPLAYSTSQPPYRTVIHASDTTLWVGTDAGLVLFDKIQRKQIRLFTQQLDSLPNNVIYSLLLDKKENLWIGTNNGLTRLNVPHFTFTTFTVIDGLPSNEFNTNTTFKSENGWMYFGGVDGISKFYPESLQENPYNPLVKITKITINHAKEVVNRDTVLSYSYQENHFQFDFAALNYSLSEKNQYKYQLKSIDSTWINAWFKKIGLLTNSSGLDTNWVLCTGKPTVEYKNLNPGHYIFKVYAWNKDTTLWWDKATQLEFEINSPPFYKKIEFWLCVCFLLVAALGSMYFYYKKTILQKEKDANKREINLLCLQLIPHFIFNVLVSISLYILKNNTSEAYKQLVNLAQLMRLVLDSVRQDKISLEEEIKLLKLYLQFEKLRLKHKLDYNFELDIPKNTNWTIPPLLTQPYVENAIKHGLNRESGGKIVIRVYPNPKTDGLNIEIEDNGIGQAAAAIKKESMNQSILSHGTNITKDRMELMNKIHKTKISTTIDDLKNPEGNPLGTKVTIKILKSTIKQ